MTHFPAFLDLRNRKTVVIGGGKVAERKVRLLLRCGARVILISPSVTAWLSGRARAGRIVLFRRSYRPRDLDGAFLTFAATDDSRVQNEIGRRARRGRSLVNVADRPELCSFIMPSVLIRSGLTVAVSTGGKSPALAQRIRRDIGDHLGGAPAELLKWTRRLRPGILKQIGSPRRRRLILRRMAGADLMKLLRSGKRSAARKKLATLLAREGLKVGGKI